MKTKEFDETSTELLRAAREILRTKGPEGLTVRGIASEAGMSTMNVYSRFNGKHGVINELYLDGFRRLAEQIDAVPATEDAIADLLNALRVYREFSLEYPYYYRIMFGTSTVPGFVPSDDAVELAFKSLFIFANRLQTAQDAGAIATHDDWPAIEISAWLWSLVHGMVSLELYQIGIEHVDWSKQFEHGIRTALDGIGVR